MDIETRNQIDDLCDEFDRGWKKHDPAAISSMLNRVDPELRAELFRELVQIDQERCLKSGRTMAAKNYHVHFPEHVRVLDQLVSDRKEPESAIDTKSCSDSSPWPPLPELPVLEQIGAYQLQERIGEGGMGVVYKAEHEELGRSVAIKIVAFPMADAVPRFQAEARTIAGLNHPHIVQIFETGEYQKRPYLVLELMQGGSLGDVLQDEVLSPRRAAEIVAQIASAISAAHELGVIHRDLKPANVLMDEDGNTKLCDFGLARNLNVDSQTVSGTMLGTPGFMSPEQTTGDTPTPAMDIYGLGAVLYAALTGRPPFRGVNIPDTLAMVRESDPVPVRALVPSVPVNLESICLKCLQNNPATRYASAAELAEELDAFLDGRPVKARPVGSGEKLIRWCRRKPTIAALSVGMLAAFSVGAVGIFIQWQRAEANAVAFQHQAIRAETEAARAAEEAARAEEEAATTAAVNNFVLDILAAAQNSPEGQDATIRHAVYAAIPRVDDAFEKHPRIEANVRATLGRTLRDLDQLTLSIEQYRLALKASRTAYGETAAETLHVMDRLAGSLRKTHDPACMTEAASLREFVLNQRITSLGETHPDTNSAMNNLAATWNSMGERDKAEELFRRALKLAEQVSGDTLTLRHNLAIFHARNGKLELAEQELKTVLRQAEKFMAADGEPGWEMRADVLEWRHSLANVLEDQGRLEAAKEQFAIVFDEQRELLGASHRETLETHLALSRILVGLGEFEEALSLVEPCLQLHNEKFGPERGRTMDVRNTMADALIGSERLDDAEQLLREAVAVLSKGRGSDHRYTLAAKKRLREFLASHGE